MQAKKAESIQELAQFKIERKLKEINRDWMEKHWIEEDRQLFMMKKWNSLGVEPGIYYSDKNIYMLKVL